VEDFLANPSSGVWPESVLLPPPRGLTTLPERKEERREN